jgi:hypothetical protein
MKKHTSEEAYYERMRNLSNINETSIKESKNRTLGTLIDYKRAPDGVAYGIVKEQHKYYIKKGGLNENLSIADFAYIGGLQNLTEFQYGKLAEAEKQRNMLFNTINESISTKVSKNGSRAEAKKMLTEDKASQEIEMATQKVDDLDAATDAAQVPAEPEIPPAGKEGGEEMDAGIDAMPNADGGDMPPVDTSADGGEEVDVDVDGEEDNGEGEETDNGEGEEGEATREIEKNLGKLTNTLRKTELTDSQIISYVKTFLSAFKEKFPDIDIEDRKEMAEKITKVVPPEDIEDLGQNVEDTDGSKTEPELAEEECSECGGFAQYAESRGYDADSIKECGEEEMTNLISGYANANSEGQNDGDFKVIALFITPEIIEKLKGDYGHEEFANQVEPFSTEMNETTTEDRDAQINELFGGLKNLAKDAGQGIKRGAQAVGQKVGDAATAVKQSYHTGELPKEVKKLEGFAANLGKQIDALNKRMKKAGKEPINVQSILTTIKNQVASGGSADLSRYTNEEGLPIDHTEVQPNMELEEENSEMSSDKINSEEEFREYATTVLKKAHGDDYDTDKADYMIKGLVNMTKASDEENWGDAIGILQQSLDESSLDEDVNIKIIEKAGKKLSPDNTPEVEMKESVEEKEDDLDIDNLDISTEETPAKETEDNFLDVSKHKEPEMDIHSGFDSMGGGVVKPDGSETTTVEVTKDSVNVSLNENKKDVSKTEKKLRKYIRNRLEEHAGIKKPSLNESAKSKAIQKLDRVIDKQFKLYESEIVKKKDNINEIFGFSVKEKFQKLDPNDAESVEKLFNSTYSSVLGSMGAVRNVAKNTPTNVKYDLIKKYVENDGGTIRLNNGQLAYQPQSLKDKSTTFAGGGRSRLG